MLPRPETLGDRIRLCRIFHGWTQTGLAHRAQMNQAQICHLETNTHTCTVPTLQRLAATLGVSCAQLLGEAPLFEASSVCAAQEVGV